MKWNDALPYEITVYPREKGLVLGDIRYEKQVLRVDQKAVEYAIEDDILYWREGGRIGSLSFMHHSRLLRGMVIENGKTYFLKACADYKVSVTLSDGRRYHIVFGSREENGDVIQYVVCREEGQETNLGYGVSYEKKDPDGYHTHIRITMLPMTDECLEFGYLDVAYDDSYTTVTGGVWEREEDAEEQEPLYTVTGGFDLLGSMEEGAGKRQLLSQICTPEQKEMLQRCSDALCVEELYTMPMPNIEEVNSIYPNALFDFMRYAISDEQRKYMGLEKPEYTEAEKQLADQMLQDADIKKFITGNYYNAQLSQMLAEHTESPYSGLITSIEKYDKRLEGYFSGSLSTSMNADRGYQKLSQILYPALYFRSSPFLEPYKADRKGWAEKLHRYALYHENTFAEVDEYSHNAQSNLQNLVTLLNYFDDSKTVKMENKMRFPYLNDEPVAYSISYGADIYYCLLNRLNMLQTYRFRLSDSIMDEGERKTYYESSFKKLIEEIYAKSQLTEEEAAIKDAVEEAVGNQTITDWTEAYAYLSLIFCEFEGTISGTDKCTLRCLAEYFDAHETIAKGFRYASMLMCQGLMLANQILSYLDWENMSDAQKTQTICSTLYTVADVSINVGKEIYRCCSNGAKVEAASASGIVNGSQNAIKPTVHLGEGEVTSVVAKTEGFFDQLAKAAKEMSAVSKLEGGILSALSFAVSVCDVINDQEIYGSKSAVYALDIVTSIVNGVAFVATVGFSVFGGILMGMTVFAAILPGIGFVCTLVGILFSFITYLVKKYSKTLEQKYIEAQCVPFVQGLEIPREDMVIEMAYDEETGAFYMKQTEK